MAEYIVKVIVSKLTEVGVKEVLQMYDVDEQVETVTRQLGWIQVFLKDADKKQITDEKQKYWVKEVRDVAYSIEDAIDTFLLEIPPKPQKTTRTIDQSMQRKVKITTKLPAVRNLVYEIEQIQKRMTEIEESRRRYEIKTLGEDNGEIQLPIRPLVLPDSDPDIVGFKEDQDYVVRQLLDETTKRRSVVSIWGAGGLGKTTLAQKVYNCIDVKKQFELRIWVAISQKFKLIDILRKIAKQVLESPIDPSMQLDDFITKIPQSLKNKRYLIVLDDVWIENIWTDQIEKVLPADGNNGSRVLLTTRNYEVAKAADPTREPYKLGYLTKELSLELFLKRAFPNQDLNKNNFDNLSDIINQFVHKCGALPLALVVLGGLLSKKPRNYADWNKVLQTMSWHADDGKKCSEIIGTSYEDLSFVLKSCFMYFSAFPEDHNINAKSLLQKWIAEDFIKPEDNRTLEQSAEIYLENLVQRSLVQVRSRSFNGTIVSCSIHDLLRDLAIQKAKEDNFFVVYSHPDDQQNLSRARRVAVHHSDCDKLVMNENLRTLLCFHVKVMPNCSKQKLLKVVSTEAVYMDSINVGMFEGLTLLRYLNLFGSPIDKCGRAYKHGQNNGQRYMEKVIGSMKYMQTLSLNLHPLYFPDCAWHINTLRHVRTGSWPKTLPPSTTLPNLQTLRRVLTNESWKTELPDLPNLRALWLVHESCSWMAIANFLRTLKNLISLTLQSSFPGEILNMKSFPFYKNLQYLQFMGRNYGETPNETVIDVIELPPNLIYLEISSCHLKQDVLSVFENLTWLKNLRLRFVKTNRKMRCSAKGFKQLEELWLQAITVLEDWEIEKGAMPILRELRINQCKELCVPQGIRHLTNLQQLAWVDNGHEGKEDEVRNLCQHVRPSLQFSYQ